MIWIVAVLLLASPAFAAEPTNAPKPNFPSCKPGMKLSPAGLPCYGPIPDLEAEFDRWRRMMKDCKARRTC